ncbi:probable plastid-lipid-associated protein 4 chloroplastic [Phtheirospermum japonicum]|uniref:Probable plastid-lipid-associated protein 4 chloroplastic n=1 Tax=Phtheirospermum japonicum TaxID=374723 RepID=A0A830BIA4_9LAMI|nr:probable plastid-lipid-associated protein 4 chloroplastic [Phtheirospermum japonicum]
MALSTLSPPSLTCTHSAASLPKLRHLSAAVNFRADLHNHGLPTSVAASPPQYAALRQWRTRVSFFTNLLSSNKAKTAEAIKEELLEAIAPLDRGAEATPEDQQTIDQIVRKLEAVNPTKEPLKSNLLNGKWELLYTTSESILQSKRPKFLRSKQNYQAINLDTLRAQNMQTGPFFNQKVAVKFDFFKLGGLIPVKAPETARGALEITYLDEELRVSRGDKGNLFILKLVDPSYRIPS